MELGKIKARIREKGFNPSIPMVVPGSNKIVWVTVQKSALMVELDKVFPTKVSETGLMFDGEKLMPVKSALGSQAAPKPEPEIEEEDDLLGGDQQLVAEMPDDDLLGPTDDVEDLLA